MQINRPPVPPEKAHEFFVGLVSGYRSAKIVFTASTLGVFDRLANQPRTSQALAAALDTDSRATDILLKALVALGVVHHDDGHFSNTPMAAEFLVSDRPKYVGNNISFQEMIWPCWSELSTVVKTGKPAAQLMDLLREQDSGFVRDYIRGMDNISQAPAKEVARLLGGSPVQRLLDVGGGPGTFAKAILESNPNAVATILDLPNTLQVTAQMVSDLPSNRVTLKPANYLSDDFGTGFDLVLLSHVTHDESPEAVQRLLAKAFESLTPGGRVAIHDFLVSEDGCSPPFSAMFSVNMLVYTTGGRTYSESDYRTALVNAGFERISIAPVLEGKVGNSTVLITGHKPR